MLKIFLDKNIRRLGLITLDREKYNSQKITAENALKRFQILINNKESLHKVLSEELQIIEDVLLIYLKINQFKRLYDGFFSIN